MGLGQALTQLAPAWGLCLVARPHLVPMHVPSTAGTAYEVLLLCLECWIQQSRLKLWSVG